jgi:activator of HSP90 ATPase
LDSCTSAGVWAETLIEEIDLITLGIFQSQAKPDTEYSLFGGGVRGKYISLTPQKEIVQTWALQSPTWPTGLVIFPLPRVVFD